MQIQKHTHTHIPLSPYIFYAYVYVIICMSSIPKRMVPPLTRQVMNEGPGHVPLHKIPDNMRKQLDWCHEALEMPATTA